ncbi:MAG: DUF1592 domain-containing protein [Verrucomicrobiota bacterium]
MRSPPTFLSAAAFALLVTVRFAAGQSTANAAPSDIFVRQIAPALEKYCTECHAGTKPEGDILLRFKDESEARTRPTADAAFWRKVSKMIVTKEMPPDDAKRQPTAADRTMLTDWITRDMLAIDCEKPDPGRLIIHRLNNREYANTLRDLLYLPADYDVAADLPADDRGAGFDNNSNMLTLSPVHIEHYLAIAEKVVPYSFNLDNKGSAPSKAKLTAPLAGFTADFSNWQEKARRILVVLTPRIYRRPVTDEEMEQLMKFVALAYTHDGESETRAVGLAVRAALMSPAFLFRLERDPAPDGTGKPYPINEFELASRLSYFLWASMPDDELFQLAKDGKLRENLEVTVKRMLRDPKASSLTTDFLGQWLEIRSLEQTPNCPPELLKAMKGETEHFFEHIATEDRSIMDFLNADYTFVNATLAKHYGMTDVEGDEFRKVPVDPEKRGGIFTQASILTLNAKPLAVKGGEATRRPSPVNRGKWILENIFNETIPPPPPGVPPLKIDDGVELKGTVRQIFEQHRADPKCALCHSRMDPYGFALENYDGFGAWREQDNHTPIDASGSINGKKFTTPKEFRAVLADRQDDFRRAFAEKLLSYALARGLEDTDKCAVDEIAAAVKADGDRFSSVILGLVKSYPFQHARGSANPPSLAGAKDAPLDPLTPSALQPISQP